MSEPTQQEKRDRILTQVDRIEALLGQPGTIYTYGHVGLILTPDQVDALLAMTGPARLFAEDEAANPGKYRANRCEANARRGTGTGTCDRPLDSHGQCDRAGDHL
jgi:hypothetical protein